ncbi:MAG: glycosyltransferase family 4 protein [Endomicrobia bacterium]|nr:glycosyltransferase family 4 protein [Endomicrobiia bacterium]
MKIGIDGREFVKNKVTGIKRFLYNFLSYIAKEKPNWDFYVFLNQYCEVNLEYPNLYKIYIPEKITFVWDQLELLKRVRQYNIDLFFSPYYKFPVFLSVPVITNIFDIMYLILPPYKNNLKYQLYIKNFIKLTAQKVKKIITCSNTVKVDLINILSIPQDKIEVIYLSVDKKFNPQPYKKVEEVKKRYNIDSKYLLYVGNSKPHKNLYRLIEAYKLLPDSIRNNYYLLLVGVKRKDLISTFKVLPSWLNIIEFLPDDELVSLYSGAEVFVFPSLYEGFGLPPLEAMACGCPVVASNISTTLEILQDAALYFNPYDINEIKESILKVLLSEKLRKELVELGFRQVKKFNLEEIGKKYIEIFNLVINER